MWLEGSGPGAGGTGPSQVRTGPVKLLSVMLRGCVGYMEGAPGEVGCEGEHGEVRHMLKSG
jgi:hypothetical protein